MNSDIAIWLAGAQGHSYLHIAFSNTFEAAAGWDRAPLSLRRPPIPYLVFAGLFAARHPIHRARKHNARLGIEELDLVTLLDDHDVHEI